MNGTNCLPNLTCPMPSITLAGALLTLAQNADPWKFTEWCSLTKMNVSPVSDDAVDDLPPGWTSDTAKSVLAFARAYWSHQHPEQFIKKRNDNNAAGRNAWISFVSGSWTQQWNMNKRIDDHMARRGRDMWGVLAAFNRTTVRLFLEHLVRS